MEWLGLWQMLFVKVLNMLGYKSSCEALNTTFLVATSTGKNERGVTVDTYIGEYIHPTGSTSLGRGVKQGRFHYDYQ